MSSFLQAHVHNIWNPVAYNQRPGAPFTNMDYCKISNISCTKSQNLYDSCFDLQLFLSHPLKPGVKPRMKMLLELVPVGAAPTISVWSTIKLIAKALY